MPRLFKAFGTFCVSSFWLLGRPRFRKSLELQISYSVGYVNRTNAFLVCARFFHEIFHDKWRLHKSIWFRTRFC